MTLNEYLCKHFEKDKDGNVTVGSIVAGIITLDSFLICFTFLFCGFITEMIVVVIKSSDVNPTLSLTHVIYYSFMWFILFYISKFIAKINVVKCPLNKKEE